jgi:hypothetical protein
VLAGVCQKLNVKPGGTSEDGKITVEFAECIGVCEGAPAVLIDDAGRGDNGTPLRGHGLVGLRERASAAGATVVTTTLDPGFSLKVIAGDGGRA